MKDILIKNMRGTHMYVGTCEYINSRDERACQIILIKNHIIFIKYNVAFPLKKNMHVYM